MEFPDHILGTSPLRHIVATGDDCGATAAYSRVGLSLLDSSGTDIFFFGLDELFSIHNSAKHLVPEWFRQIGLFKLR